MNVHPLDTEANFYIGKLHILVCMFLAESEPAMCNIFLFFTSIQAFGMPSFVTLVGDQPQLCFGADRIELLGHFLGECELFSEDQTWCEFSCPEIIFSSENSTCDWM